MTSPGLPRATAESQGISSAAILEFVDRAEAEIHELHSVMLLRNGNVVAEGWWKPYDRELIHHLFSLTKSFTSTAVGLAIAEGRLSLDDPVVSFLPGDLPDEVGVNLAAMRVRHLLTMTTGHGDDSWPFVERAPGGNWPRAFLARPVEHEPGTFFLYDTGASHVLSTIVQARTGERLVDYLRQRLFAPLGIDDVHWREDPRGASIGGMGLSIRTEDVAAFGQLYLQKGEWRGRQLVPRDWVELATARQVENGTDPANDWNQGYGFQFWRCRHDAYRADGAFGQYCIVMPKQNAVLAMTGAVPEMQPVLDLVWETVLPALRDGSPLPENEGARGRLTERLAGLGFAPPSGSRSSAAARDAGGRTYDVAANPMGVEALRFAFDADGGCLLSVTSVKGVATLDVGYGYWKPGETAMFGEPLPVVTAGAWTSETTYTAVSRAHLTPFHYLFDVRFDGDRVRVESRPNVAFGPIEPLVLDGRWR